MEMEMEMEMTATESMGRTGTTRWPEVTHAKDWSKPLRVRGPLLRMAWVEFLDRVPWKWFVTLTFDEKRVFPVDQSRAAREAVRWCGLIGWTLRRPVGWLVAPERGASGLWHAHALLVGVPNDISAFASIWQVRNGRIDVQRVVSSPGVVLYTTKEAACTGTVLLSDTLSRYRTADSACAGRIALYPVTE